MMRVRLAVLSLAATACVVHTGLQPSEFSPASSGTGINANLTVGQTKITGELLEVRDTAVVILTPDRVLLVPFPAIAHGTFAHTDMEITNGLRRGDDDNMTDVRMLSRYPYGIPADALRRLLASRRQDSLAVIHP
jgi:hypothetical protein